MSPYFVNHDFPHVSHLPRCHPFSRFRHVLSCLVRLSVKPFRRNVGKAPLRAARQGGTRPDFVRTRRGLLRPPKTPSRDETPPWSEVALVTEARKIEKNGITSL